MPKSFLYFIFFLLLSSHQFSQSLKLDSLSRLLQTCKSDKERVQLLNGIAKEEENDNKAIIYANKALALATRLKDESERGKSLNIIGCAYFNKESYSDAISYLSRAFRINKDFHPADASTRSLLYLGRSYYELGKYSEALDFLKQALRYKDEVTEYPVLAVLYNSLGGVYLDLGNLPLAHEYYMMEVDISEKYKLNPYLAQGYNNLALIYDAQKKYDKALEYYQKDLALSLKDGDEEALSLSYNNIGDIYLTLGNYAKAKENIEKAVEIAERLNYSYGLAIFYNSLGTYYDRTGDEKKALENYQKDYEYALKAGNKYNLCESYYTLGDFSLRNNRLPDAEKYFSKSLELANEINALQAMSDAHAGLARVYESRGDFRSAFNNHVKFKKYYDSVFTKESEKTVTELSSRYETEKKEQTIELLNKETELKNNEIKKQKLIRYSFTIGFILMIGLVFMVFSSYRTKRRANEKLTIQKKEIEIKNRELHRQKDLINEKQKEIVDSINYARRIQDSLLAHASILDDNLKEHFVVYKPKDIVSGDFYWATTFSSESELPGSELSPQVSSRLKTPELFYLAVCDSTGHGVPGAFMSLLNIGFLSEAIKEKGITKPNEVFDYVRERLIENVSREEQKDGFDGALLCINSSDKSITYTAANNKLILVDEATVEILPTDKMPVGIGENLKPFTLYTVPEKSNSMLYIVTDGYADQFGGPKGKKFKYKQLTGLLSELSKKTPDEQCRVLNETFDNWKGNLEQVDDVCLFGVRL